MIKLLNPYCHIQLIEQVPFYSTIEERVAKLRKELRNTGNIGAYLRGIKALVDEGSQFNKEEEAKQFITPNRVDEEEKKFTLSPQVMRPVELEVITLLKERGIGKTDELEVLGKLINDKPQREQSLLKMLKASEVNKTVIENKIKAMIQKEPNKPKFSSLSSAITYFGQKKKFSNSQMDILLGLHNEESRLLESIWNAFLKDNSKSSMLESLVLLCESKSIQKKEELDPKEDDTYNCKKSMHTVLARIVMDGMLDYIAALYIHELINQGDPLTFGIFELFSHMKDQEDFLENVNLLSKSKKRQSICHENDEKQKNLKKELCAQKINELFEADESGKLIELLNDEECHAILPAFEVWDLTKDDDDLKETLSSLIECEKAKPSP